MKIKKIGIASDHIGFALKADIINYLKARNYEVVDFGPHDTNRTHYPIYGHKCATAVAKHEIDRGIIMCGTGIGIVNSANKTKGCRAALAEHIITVQHAVQHYNINILALGAQVTGPGLASQLIDVFLSTEYLGRNDANINHINKLIKTDNYNKNIFKEMKEKWKKGYYHD